MTVDGKPEEAPPEPSSKRGGVLSTLAAVVLLLVSLGFILATACFGVFGISMFTGNAVGFGLLLLGGAAVCGSIAYVLGRVAINLFGRS